MFKIFWWNNYSMKILGESQWGSKRRRDCNSGPDLWWILSSSLIQFFLIPPSLITTTTAILAPQIGRPRIFLPGDDHSRWQRPTISLLRISKRDLIAEEYPSQPSRLSVLPLSCSCSANSIIHFHGLWQILLVLFWEEESVLFPYG